MKERILFDLAPGWALGCDKSQWMVMRRFGKPGKEQWVSQAYIGGSKTTLVRVINELGITPIPEAWGKIAALPETFLKWRQIHF